MSSDSCKGIGFKTNIWNTYGTGTRNIVSAFCCIDFVPSKLLDEFWINQHLCLLRTDWRGNTAQNTKPFSDADTIDLRNRAVLTNCLISHFLFPSSAYEIMTRVDLLVTNTHTMILIESSNIATIVKGFNSSFGCDHAKCGMEQTTSAVDENTQQRWSRSVVSSTLHEQRPWSWGRGLACNTILSLRECPEPCRTKWFFNVLHTLSLTWSLSDPNPHTMSSMSWTQCTGFVLKLMKTALGGTHQTSSG